MSRSIKLYLDDILKSINKIQEYTTDLTLDNFTEDYKTQDAVLRNLEIIGEAVKNIPDEIKIEYEYDWREVAGLRDILIHHYFGISLQIVWDIIQNELKELENVIRKISSDIFEEDNMTGP